MPILVSKKMNKPLIMILFLLQLAHESNGQCENKLDSLGRKQGHWCFNKYKYNYLRDSTPFKYMEGHYVNDNRIGKWYFYVYEYDLRTKLTIEYLKDSGIIINDDYFISNDSSFLVTKYVKGRYMVKCCYDSLTKKYLCEKRFSWAYYYEKEFETFNDAKDAMIYKWRGPYYLREKKKRKLINDETKFSEKYLRP